MTTRANSELVYFRPNGQPTTLFLELIAALDAKISVQEAEIVDLKARVATLEAG